VRSCAMPLVSKDGHLVFKATGAERVLLSELGALADGLRALRAASQPNADEIRAVEAQVSLKWQQLRLLRAGPINTEAHPPSRKSGRA
jgi:hypothetical protein